MSPSSASPSTTTASSDRPTAPAWRSPWLILLAGCTIALVSFGPRASLGLFTVPVTVDRGFSLELFSFAMAVQNLAWGLGQPIAGGLADRYGTMRVLIAGLLAYALGLVIMALGTDALALNVGGGILIGMGLSGAAFGLVIAAFAKLLPEAWRGMAFGLGTAAGSFGQFLFAPLAVALIRDVGWVNTLLVFAVMLLCCLPLTLVLATQPRPATPGGGEQTFAQALRQAFAHPSYRFLVAGFFVCGFHIAFITIHLPKYIAERGLSAEVGAWTLAAIGLFNIAGSLGSGYLMTRLSKRWLLAGIYLARSVAIALFVLVPMTPASTILFGAALGLLWLSTVPPTNGLVVVMFGTRWLGLLGGIVFLSHQIGAFLALVLAGFTRQATGSYDIVWGLSILLGIFAALINLPIRERPVALQPRPA